MEYNEVCKNLCYNDIRSPYYEEDTSMREAENGGCFCDNCFYGCHVLALEILKLSE